MTTRPTSPTPSGTRSDTVEFKGLTGLRIVAAAWVVLFHAHFTPLPSVAALVQALGPFRPIVQQGALGVDLFFVLSGFVIAHTYLDRMGPALRVRETVRFVWARVCRIWPLYVVVLHLFGIWVLARSMIGDGHEVAFQAVQPDVSVWAYLRQLVMVQLWGQPFFDGASWIGPTWSISAEWLAYLLFPVAVLGFFRMRRLPAPVLLLAATALMVPIAWSYVALGHPYFPWSWAVRVLCGFGAGVLVCLAVRRGAFRPRTASLAAVGLPVLLVACLVVGERLGAGRGGVAIVMFPLLVGVLAVADRGPAMILSTGWAGFGGRVSYALYVVHIPILEVYWLALGRFPALGARSLFATAVCAGVVLSTAVAAVAVYFSVEEPARRRMRGWLPTPPRHGKQRELATAQAVPLASRSRTRLVA